MNRFRENIKTRIPLGEPSPLIRPAGTFSPDGGEGWDEGAFYRNRASSAVIDRRYSPASISSLICLLVILFTHPATAQDAIVHATVTTNEAWVGEPVTVVVELFAPGYFDSAPSFDFPDPPNLLLLPPAEHPIVRHQLLDNTNYTVQRYELTVFARRAGAQVVPPLAVKFQFKRGPLDKNAEAAVVKTEPVDFTSKLPPGAEKLGNVISARKLQLTETWQPELTATNFKAGDAFTRTITFSAPNLPGMVFPPFPAGKIDGLSIYPKPSEVLDHSARGRLQGERRDIITYVCERPGRFVIPATQLIWFDLESQQLRTNDFPARTFNVRSNLALAAGGTATNPISGAVLVSAKGKYRTLIGLGSVVVFVFLVALFWRLRLLWQPMLAPFRPVHLNPLNPEMKSKPQP